MLTKEAIRIDNGIKKIKGAPIAGYDVEKRLAYLGYPDGRRKYAASYFALRDNLQQAPF